MIIKHIPRLKFTRSLGIIFLLLLLTLFSMHVLAINIPDTPTSRVVDQTNSLTQAQQQSLISNITNVYRTESHTEIQILMISSLDNAPIEDVSLDVARKWKIGQKNINNGILILVAVKDHKYRIEVGYGLEGVLPDGYIGNLERNIINPYFAKNDYFNGLTLAILDMQKQIAHEYKSQASTQGLSPQAAILYVLIGAGVLVIIAILGAASGNPALIMDILWFIVKLLTLFMLFRGAGRDGNNDDNDIGGGGGFGGGGSSNKW